MIGCQHGFESLLNEDLPIAHYACDECEAEVDVIQVQGRDGRAWYEMVRTDLTKEGDAS